MIRWMGLISISGICSRCPSFSRNSCDNTANAITSNFYRYYTYRLKGGSAQRLLERVRPFLQGQCDLSSVFRAPKISFKNPFIFTDLFLNRQHIIACLKHGVYGRFVCPRLFSGFIHFPFHFCSASVANKLDISVSSSVLLHAFFIQPARQTCRPGYIFCLR